MNDGTFIATLEVRIEDATSIRSAVKAADEAARAASDVHGTPSRDAETVAVRRIESVEEDRHDE